MSSRKVTLDPGDIRILKELQCDSSRPVAEIAKAVGMSQTPCWRRIKRLREIGVIRAQVTLLDRQALGLDFVAYTFVKLGVPSREHMEEFDRRINGWPEVVSCERVTGAVDYLIKVVVDDIRAYDDFLRYKLLNDDLVTDVQSRIVVATVKESTALPVFET